MLHLARVYYSFDIVLDNIASELFKSLYQGSILQLCQLPKMNGQVLLCETGQRLIISLCLFSGKEDSNTLEIN